MVTTFAPSSVAFSAAPHATLPKPEIATVEANLQKVEADYMEHIQSIQVEMNRKMDELSKLPETTSETTKSLKNNEIMDLQRRLEVQYQDAQQGLQKAQIEQMQPLSDKVDAAVKKICKAQNIIVVFQNDSVVYIDEDEVVDITAAVKTELGIPADAVPVISESAQ